MTADGPAAVGISTATVGKTIAGASIKGQGNDLVIDTVSFYRPSQPGAYPIVLATYEIVCSKYPDAAIGTAVKAVLHSPNLGGPERSGGNAKSPYLATFNPQLTTTAE